ncbi:MAG: hypothetical protein RI957_232 [Verrucomicrobiota bacterium]|jgi:hypothetical protein
MNLSKPLFVGLFVFSMHPVMAQLPALQEKPWLGHFVGYEQRGFQFGVKEDGKMVFEAKNRKGSFMGFDKAVNISAEVVEMVAGKPVVKQIIAESLVSPDKATDKPKKTSFRGKVTGDAEFEMVLEFDGDTILMGGRLLGNGTLTNPLHFQIRVRHADVYGKTQADRVPTEAKKDRLEFTRLDKKKGKAELLEAIDLGSEAISGKGLSEVAVELKCYEDRKFEYSPVGDGLLVMESPRGQAAAPRDGFSVIWRPDATKDKDGKGRLKFVFK